MKASLERHWTQKRAETNIHTRTHTQFHTLFSYPAVLSSRRRPGSRDAALSPWKILQHTAVVCDAIPAFAGMTMLMGKKKESVGVGKIVHLHTFLRVFVFFVFLLLSSVFLLFSSVSSAHAQTQISKEPPEVIEVFEEMYRYNLPEAELKLKALNATNIDQNWIDLAHVNLLWWWLISGDDSRDYDNLMTVVLNRVINRTKIRPVEKMTNEEVFTMIHSYAYLTRVDIYQERYFKGIVNLRHTLDFLEIALNKVDQYDKFMMVSGLYNYFAAVTLIKYPVFTPFFAFAPQSNRVVGFQLLNRCSRMDNILIKNESLYYLMKINYQLEEHFEEALGIADQLISKYPNNLIYHFHRFMILIEANRRPQALAQYSKLIEVSMTAPNLNSLQRNHLIDIAKKRLLKEKINPAI